jgi:hypothetical protein|tara:strand:+ start:2072 stop:2884 length:813 start_codon:yes stop_codon:yes gene_type:complete
MTNDLWDILQNNPSLQTDLDEDTIAVATSGSDSTKRISIRGGSFHKVVDGKEVSTVEDDYMKVIIVKMAHVASRTYYEGAYEEGKPVAPACWSTDSKVPDTEVSTPQAKLCDMCEFSIRGSGTGGMGAACKLSWRVAVVLPDNPSGDVMQMILPATSVFGKENSGKWPFRPYVQMLANNSVSAGNVVTKMQFDLESSIPKLYFSPAAAVNAKDVEILKKQAKSSTAEEAIKMNVYKVNVNKSPFNKPKPILNENDIDTLMDKWGVQDKGD